MRRLGAAGKFAVLRVAMAGLVSITALFGVDAVATAEPPAVAPISVVLSVIPDGWAGRTDLVPMLQVQADGQAVKSPDAISEDRKQGAAPQQLNGRIAPEVLAAALAEAKALANVDMGTPEGGYRGSALLDFLGATPDQDVHLVNYSPAVTDGLSEEQITARHRFADLCRKLLDAFVQNR
ncbi:hypothetical protein NDR87_31180 [Nocardia sp. CDC159]|uniref:Secreted protein n=1 Tax=Nocardia pulmonis TaxID=2951408 RepID=A0A9X2J1D1_9NOCA|nr:MULTISPECIES: hypothetical protein [Nocardia]MCM6777985.1 hypothetical protein [Nocardia pulmonis]MCM6790844.1 hypothetical protein [Nocardia sp. CDC159]